MSVWTVVMLVMLVSSLSSFLAIDFWAVTVSFDLDNV